MARTHRQAQTAEGAGNVSRCVRRRERTGVRAGGESLRTERQERLRLLVVCADDCLAGGSLDEL